MRNDGRKCFLRKWIKSSVLNKFYRSQSNQIFFEFCFLFTFLFTQHWSHSACEIVTIRHLAYLRSGTQSCVGRTCHRNRQLQTSYYLKIAKWKDKNKYEISSIRAKKNDRFFYENLKSNSNFVEIGNGSRGLRSKKMMNLLQIVGFELPQIRRFLSQIFKKKIWVRFTWFGVYSDSCA